VIATAANLFFDDIQCPLVSTTCPDPSSSTTRNKQVHAEDFNR
jgi:hypothetical protein